MHRNHLRHRAAFWALCFGFWTFLGLLNVTQSYVHRHLSGSPIVWPEILVVAFADWSAWAALTPLILYLAGRFPLEPPVWCRHLLLHAAASVLAGLAVACFVALA